MVHFIKDFESIRERNGLMEIIEEIKGKIFYVEIVEEMKE